MVLPAFCSSSYTSFDWCFQLSILVTIPVWLGASSFLFQLLYQSGLVLPAFCSIYYTSLAWCFQLSVLVTIPLLVGASSFLFHLLYQSGLVLPAFCSSYCTSFNWCFQLSFPFTIPVWLWASSFLFHLYAIPAWCFPFWTFTVNPLIDIAWTHQSVSTNTLIPLWLQTILQEVDQYRLTALLFLDVRFICCY